MEDAIEFAMKNCINKGILKEFLETNGSEVVNVLFTEFNLADALQVREEEGRQEGWEEAHRSLIKKMLQKMDVKSVSDATGISMEQIKEMLKADLQ